MKQPMAPTEFLREQGFEILNRMAPKIQYDFNALKKLKTEYNCNFTDLASIIGTTKQNLDTKLKVKRKYPNYWQDKTFGKEQLDILQLMIREHQFAYDDDKMHVRFYKHKDTKELAIFIKEEQEIICLFKLPGEVKEQLIAEKYHLYDAPEFEIITEIKNSDMLALNTKGVEELRFRTSEYPSLNNKVNTRITKLNTNRGEYFSFLGFQYVDGRSLTDDEIIAQLSVYKVENTNIVHIPCSDSNHYRFANLANNKGFSSIKSFLNNYGFEYKRIRIAPPTNYVANIIAKLKAHYIVYGNKVYINSYDPTYVSLANYSRKNKRDLNEILIEWGFYRIYKNDLPSGYEPYNWSENQNYVLKNEDDYKRVLDDLIIEDNLVYLDSESYFYSKLYRVSIKYGLSMNEMLEEWGYKRIYFYEANEKTHQDIVIKSDNEADYIDEIIGSLKGIQGDLSISKTEWEKKSRSQKLATEIKKLYAYQCQLCCHHDEEGIRIPPIEKEDGTFYVEAHHIIPVSASDLVSDDAVGVIIDSYENVVVVCPYHHRVLHYHNGGFNEIVDKDKVLYFKSKNGDLLRIYTNYHLKVIEPILI